MGRRIVQLAAAGAAGGVIDASPAAVEVGQYWDRLKNLIPAEVSAIYVAGQGVIPPNEKLGLVVWAGACLLFTVLFMARQTQKVEGQPGQTCPVDWAHVAISSVSFLLWVYALGGPFAAYGLYLPWVGTLMMLGWTFVVPYLYRGQPA